MLQMRVTKRFTRSFGGQLFHGDPEHKRPEGRFLTVSEAVAAQMEAAGVAKRREFADEADAAGESVEGAAADAIGSAIHTSVVTGTGDKFAGGPRPTAQSVRENRTGGRSRRGKSATSKKVKSGDTVEAGLPAGGTPTNASTNHPANSGPETGTAPDPDAAPTS